MSSHRQSQPQQAGVVVRGSADRFGALAVRAGKKFVKSHPKISIAWVVGLLISILASGFTPSQEAVQKYEVKMADMDDRALAESYDEFLFWQESYRRSRGWFWSCDEQCQHDKRMFEETRQAHNALEREYQRGVAEAKSELGLFSEDGVAETRELFWTKVAGGKRFAKRATVWDAMFVSIGSFQRDEGLAAIIAKVAFRFILNLTVGLFMAVIQFLFSIWKVIWSYQPDPISTAAFFAMAALGAVSLLVAWFLGIAAVGAVGVYAVAKVTENAQIEAERRGGGYYVQQQQQQQAWSSSYNQQQQAWSRSHNQQQQARYRRPGPAQTHTPNWNHID